ncbi:MAG: hypothetical protein LBB89_06405 [Treponema sp.]|nr:hypothetical protein [Treponema sp.]
MERKNLVIFLTVCIAFSVIFAAVLTAADHEHDCTGEGCPVCLHIEAAQYFLKTLKLSGVGLLLVLYSAFLSQTAPDTTLVVYPFSQIALKVRFNS